MGFYIGFYYSIYFISHSDRILSPLEKNMIQCIPWKVSGHVFFFRTWLNYYTSRACLLVGESFHWSDPFGYRWYPLPPTEDASVPRSERSYFVLMASTSQHWERALTLLRGLNTCKKSGSSWCVFLDGWFCFFCRGPSPGVPKYCVFGWFFSWHMSRSPLQTTKKSEVWPLQTRGIQPCENGGWWQFFMEEKTASPGKKHLEHGGISNVLLIFWDERGQKSTRWIV